MREPLESLSKSRSVERVFPDPTPEGHISEGSLYWFWRRAHDEAGIVADAWPHDLRHSHASHAIMNGESLRMAGRLLGLLRTATPIRHVHFDDAALSEAAERVAVEIEGKLQAQGPDTLVTPVRR